MKTKTFWNVWTQDLPASLSKKEAIEQIKNHWGLSYGPTYRRLRGGMFPNFVKDISFMYQNFGIGFNMDRGFFFDHQQFELINEKEELENARIFNLSK